jgi:hypothetical protein
LPATDPELYRAASEWRARNWQRFQDPRDGEVLLDGDGQAVQRAQFLAPALGGRVGTQARTGAAARGR